MSYALRRLAASISKSKCVVVFINQLRAQIGMSGYGGPQETTTGGRALKFYSSVRIEVRRGKSITKGDSIIGHELWIKVVKNKQAPPFRVAHASLIYGRGIPKAMAILDMALDMDVIKKRGSWLAYKGETLGQGKEKVAQLMEEQPELMEEIAQEVKSILAETAGLVNLSPPRYAKDEDASKEERDENSDGMELGDEEEILELEVDDSE
jgi:recombination protein RecA